MIDTSYPKLSICIPTFNRAALIGQTLESIISQATDRCEIVVSDNSSTDNTKDVVFRYMQRFERLRYFRQGSNVGPDRNFDCAVQHAEGDYCWLMSDDDVVRPGAVGTLLHALSGDLSLVLVNRENLDFSLSRVLVARFLLLQSDKTYKPNELDSLFSDTGWLATYCGSVVIKRSIWMSRNRERYYGSMFLHVGVIFQSPLPSNALVIAQPLVSYREGNRLSFSDDAFEVILIKLPTLVWSLPLSESTKKAFCSRSPWRSVSTLLFYRAAGLYSLDEFRRLLLPHTPPMLRRLMPALVASLPGAIVNLVYSVGLILSSHHQVGIARAWLERSPFHLMNLFRSRRGNA